MTEDAQADVASLDWFEIPALDIERAATFCTTIFDIEARIGQGHAGYPMALLPA